MFAFIGKIAWGVLFSRAKANAVRGWQAIPPKVKLWLLIAIAALILGFVHQLYAHRQAAKQYHAGYAQALKDVATRNAKVNATTTAIAQDERKKSDAETIHISSDADAQRVRGPGKAVCPSVAAAASGHQPQAGTGDVALVGLPPAERLDLIALPFDDTIAFAKEHDLDRDEVTRWRSWYDRLAKAWPK